MLYWLTKWVFQILVAIIVRPKITGRENIPEGGPRVFISNHLDTLDIILLLAALPTFYRLHILFKEDNHPLMRLAIKIFLGGFTVHRSVGEKNPSGLSKTKFWGNLKTFRRINKLMQKGEAIYISPEGHRSDDGNLQRAKRGVGFVLKQNQQALVIPIGVIGTKGFIRGGFGPVLAKIWTYFWGKGEPIELRIGKPFTITPEETRLSSQLIADLAMEKIAQLLPPEKLGPYAYVLEG